MSSTLHNIMIPSYVDRNPAPCSLLLDYSTTCPNHLCLVEVLAGSRRSGSGNKGHDGLWKIVDADAGRWRFFTRFLIKPSGG